MEKIKLKLVRRRRQGRNSKHEEQQAQSLDTQGGAHSTAGDRVVGDEADGVVG